MKEYLCVLFFLLIKKPELRLEITSVFRDFKDLYRKFTVTVVLVDYC